MQLHSDEVGRQLVLSLHADEQPPFLVAHRAGNRIADLRVVEQLRVALLVEADVRLFRGKLEVRHLKSVGPLPIFWDRWRLAAPWRRRLQLHELLCATSQETELMLDLKGRDDKLAGSVLRAIAPYVDTRRFMVCARHWPLLDVFSGHPVRRVWSVGTARQLRRLLRRCANERIDGVSIHERLVDAPCVARLRELATTVMTWPVNHPERARELLALGVHGLISDEPGKISRAGLLEATT
jgi:hypothetical protein